MKENLKRLRKKSGFTQLDVATVLGIKQATVSMWETGQSLPPTDKLPKLAELYGCTIDALYTAN